MKPLLQIARLAPALLSALSVGLVTGCTTLPPMASIKATANEPGLPAGPAKVHVVSRSIPHHGIKTIHEFSERYGAKYQEKLDERYAAALAAGELWAKREAARIEDHAKFAPTVAAEFAAKGYTVVSREEADFTVSFSLASIPWEEIPLDGRIANQAAEPPRDDVRFDLWVDRNSPNREAGRFPLWHGELHSETLAPPKTYVRTLLLHLGRNFDGDTPSVGN